MVTLPGDMSRGQIYNSSMLLQPQHYIWSFHHGFLFYTATVVGLGLILNSMALYTFTRYGKRKYNHNLYLATLAISDTGTLIFNFSVGVTRALSHTVNDIFLISPKLCQAHGVLIEFFTLQSAWTIVCVTLERFLLVSYPQKYSPTSPARWARISAACFASVLSVSLTKINVPGFEAHSAFGYKSCRRVWPISEETPLWISLVRSPMFVYLYVVLNTWIPVLIILVLNTLICIVLGKRRRSRAVRVAPLERSSQHGSNAINENNESEFKENQVVPNGKKITDVVQLKSFVTLKISEGHDPNRNVSSLDCRERVSNLDPGIGSSLRVNVRSGRRESKATRLLFMVSFTHLFLILPLGIAQMAELVVLRSRGKSGQMVPVFSGDYGSRSKVIKDVRIIFFGLYELSYAINYVLYLIYPSKHRIWEILCAAVRKFYVRVKSKLF